MATLKRIKQHQQEHRKSLIYCIKDGDLTLVTKSNSKLSPFHYYEFTSILPPEQPLKKKANALEYGTIQRKPLYYDNS